LTDGAKEIFGEILEDERATAQEVLISGQMRTCLGAQANSGSEDVGVSQCANWQVGAREQKQRLLRVTFVPQL
jgi:hypothetical protein